MALRLAGVTPSPLLDQPAFGADGAPARLRTYSGEIAIAQDSGIIIYRSGGHIDTVPMSFVPPDAEALKAGAEPALTAEVTIAQILATGSADHFGGAGAGAVAAALQPDQSDPAWWLAAPELPRARRPTDGAALPADRAHARPTMWDETPVRTR